MHPDDHIPQDPKMLGLDPEHAELMTFLSAQKLRSAAALMKQVRGMLRRVGLAELEQGEIEAPLRALDTIANRLCEHGNNQGERMEWFDLLDADDIKAMEHSPGRTPGETIVLALAGLDPEARALIIHQVGQSLDLDTLKALAKLQNG